MKVEVENLTAEEVRAIVKEEINATLGARLDLIMAAMLIQQKDASELAEVSPRTISNKIKTGEIKALAQEGSRKNYITLKSIEGLRPRPVRESNR